MRWTTLQMISHPMESCRVLTGCVLHRICLISPPPCPADNITCDAKLRPNHTSLSPPKIYMYIHSQSDMSPDYLRIANRQRKKKSCYSTAGYVRDAAVSITCLNERALRLSSPLLPSPPLPARPEISTNLRAHRRSEV